MSNLHEIEPKDRFPQYPDNWRESLAKDKEDKKILMYPKERCVRCSGRGFVGFNRLKRVYVKCDCVKFRYPENNHIVPKEEVKVLLEEMLGYNK